jgi:putative transposase
MALRYVELHPVRAGLAKYAWEWPWSSARAHVTGIDSTGLLNMRLWSSRYDGDSWRNFLDEGEGLEEEQRQILAATRTGRPFGSKEYISDWRN